MVKYYHYNIGGITMSQAEEDVLMNYHNCENVEVVNINNLGNAKELIHIFHS